jgi:thiamine-phosphate pyrophosphorylase
MADNVESLIRLMLVSDDRLVEGRDLVALALAAERGGATSVQLRLKRASPREQVEGARALVASLRIPVLVNDRPDIALAAGAAGVHLGPDDLPVALARRVVPPRFIVGVSVGSVAEGEVAGAADYWGIGPWRATETKPDAGKALGPEGFRRLVALAGRTPCIAVGAVRPEDLPLVVAAGGAGVAVISGILGERDVEQATRRYAGRSPSP